MKKFILLSITVLVLAISAKADDKEAKANSKFENISENVLREFSYNFYKASNVKWSITNKFQKATFILNGKEAFALYDLKNQFLVATQSEEFNSLPETAKNNIIEKYANLKEMKVLKILSRAENYEYNDDTDSFWVSLVNDNQQVILLVSPSATISVVSSTKISS